MYAVEGASQIMHDSEIQGSWGKTSDYQLEGFRALYYGCIYYPIPRVFRQNTQYTTWGNI
jgi:hypothetical protein